MPAHWTVTEDCQCVYRLAAVDPEKAVLAFDLDGTLIRPRGGRKFPTSAADWTWNIPFPTLLHNLRRYRMSYNLVIFSNQGTLKTDEAVAEFVQKKVNVILSHLETPPDGPGVPVSVFLARGMQSRYRKPNDKMWSLYCRAAGLAPDPIDCFVGDAAGRMADFSDSDRKFALNVGSQFQTPEQFFGPGGARPLPPVANPADTWMRPVASPVFVFQNRPEIVVLHGCPSCGKTTWTLRHIPDATLATGRPPCWVSQDKLGTWQRCIKATEKALTEGRTAIIDNTNYDRKTRARYISLARNFKVPVRCVHFVLAPDQQDLPKHLNEVRADHPNPLVAHAPIPPVAFSGFASRQEPLASDEGFQEIFIQPFVYDPATTPPADFRKWH
jgi:bifunctional polynucleotide phosphatase/kinase